MLRFASRLALGLLGVAILLVPVLARADVESGFGSSTGGGLASEDQSFKTELFSGAATSSVPFVLPPGPNGFQPELGLRYNSQSGNGWTGRGWQLGTPEVERATKYRAPEFNDDPATGDFFALSDDLLVRDDAGTYHSTRENFARIERVDVAGVVDHWVVHRTNGETQHFGATADARVVNAQGKTLRWLLSRAEDPNGNYIKYVYTTPGETGDDGSAYLKQITYGVAGDEALGSATIRTVDFTLGPRPDATIAYRAGIRMEMSHRLEAVEVKYGGQRIARYELAYADEESAQPANGASLLRRVTRLGAAGTATLPSDTFTYSGASAPTWTLDTALGTALQSLTIGAGAALEHPNLGNGHWQIVDVNGDGVPDLIGAKDSGIDTPFYQKIFLNDRSATAFRNDEIPIPGALDLPANPENAGVRLTDYDGDGKLDVVYWYFQFANDEHVYRNFGYQWTEESTLPEEIASGWFYPPIPMAHFCTLGSNVGWTILADVDGNGYPDLVNDGIPSPACSGARTVRRVYLNNGYGWPDDPDATWSAALSTAMTSLGAAAVWELHFFDLNGDGLLDVARDANNDGVLDSATVLVNTQKGWQTDSGFAIPAGFRPVDLNGDGLADHAGASAQLNRGTSLGGSTFSLPGGFGTYAADKVFSDIDGDGLVDLVQANGSTAQVWRAGATTIDNLLVHIDRGLGATVDLVHRSSTDGSCYDASFASYDFDRSGCHADPLLTIAPSNSLANCTYPFVPWATISGTAYCMMPFELLPFAVQAVESVTVDDHAGNVRTDRVRFTHGLFDPGDREFRGFGRTIERPDTLSYTDPKYGGTVSLTPLRITQFYQRAFLRGEIAALDLWNSADDQLGVGDYLLERTANAYAYTRGDFTGTYILLGDAVVANGNALECDPASAQIIPDCSLYDLQTDPYSTALTLPSPLPYQGFQNAFCNAVPTNRDCWLAYLVLPVASQTMRWDQTTPTLEMKVRWHESHGNVQAEWDRGDDADATDDRVTVRTFAAPASGAPVNFYGVPSRTWRQNVTGVILADTRVDYDGLPNGQVRKGRATAIVQDLDDLVQGITNSTVTTTASYDDANAGLPTTVSDPFTPGETPRYTTYGYNTGKSFVTTTTRGALVTTTTYDPPGAPPGLGIARFVDDPNGNRTTSGADNFGRPTSTAIPTASGSQTVELNVYFDTPGWITTQRMRTSTYDGNGNEVQVRQFTDGLGRITRVTTTGLDENDAAATIRSDTRYDKLGRVSYQERPILSGASSGTTVYYDIRGRTRYAVQPDGGIQETAYDGLSTRQIDAMGNWTDSLRDGAGSVTQRVQYPTAGGGGVAQITKYVYDPLGRLQLVCDPLAASCGFAAGGGLPVAADPKHTVLIGYDTLSRRIRLVDPDRGEERFRYDGAGNLTRRTDARGWNVDYGYDALGRLGSITNYGYVPPYTDSLTYGDQLPVATRPSNSMGRVATATGYLTARTYDYDAVGRTARVETLMQGFSQPYVTDYTYDRVGRVKSTTYPDGEIVTNTYDLMGLDSVASSQRTYVSDIRHNAESSPLTVTYGNGDVRTSQYYASSGYLRTLTARKTGASTDFMSFSYGYDLAARITSVTDVPTPSETLSNVQYDGISRLKQLVRNGQTLTYGYDAVGNLTQKDGVTQRFEHLTKPHALYENANPSKFEYDLAGNLTKRDTTTLRYDALGRLQLVSSSSSQLGSFYSYDSSGERVFAQRGADISYFLGPDYEIKNRVRYVKTIRAEGMIVAQVSGMLPPQGAMAPWLRGTPADPAPIALTLAGLALLGVLAGAARRNELAPAWQRGLAAGLVVVIVAGPTLPALAAAKGNVHADDRLDAADGMLVVRSLAGKITLTQTQITDADVAPLVAGESVGDGRVDANDANLLLRAAQGVDVDGDGLSGDQERQSGTWPLDRDSDGNGIPDNLDDTDSDGVANATEFAQGTSPLDPDSDGDGYADGDDPLPILAAGTLVAYVHTDHLGSSAVLTDTTGTVMRRLRYQVFGQLKSNVLQSGAPVTTLDPAQKYTGQQLDGDTGLVYYGARWYDAQYGRFVTPDSIVSDPLDPQSLNRYAYVRNSPLNATDPSGHDPLWDYGYGEWADHGLDLDQFDLGGSDDFDFGGYEYDWDTEFSSFGSSGYHVLDFGNSSGSSSFEWAMGSASYVLDVPADVFQSWKEWGPDLLQQGYDLAESGLVQSEMIPQSFANEIDFRPQFEVKIPGATDPTSFGSYSAAYSFSRGNPDSSMRAGIHYPTTHDAYVSASAIVRRREYTAYGVISDFGSPLRALQGTILHEYGHHLGLDETGAIMLEHGALGLPFRRVRE